MRRGVVRANPAAAPRIDFRANLLADPDGPAADFAHVRPRAVHAPHVGHLEMQPGVDSLERPAVTHLATALRIKRRPSQQHRHVLPLLRNLQGLPGLPVDHADHHRAGHLQLRVPEKLGRPCGASELRERGVRRDVDAGACGARAFALRRHARLEARAVDRESAFRGGLFGELEREAVRIIQLECVVPRDHLSSRRALNDFRKLHLAAIKRRPKAALLRGQLPEHDGALLLHLPVPRGRGHDHCDLRQPSHDGLRHAQHPRVADHPADEAAEHVAAADVAGADAVCCEVCGGAGVVGDDLEADLLGGGGGGVRDGGEGFDLGEERAEEVGVEV
mmetsp:Transcript_20569/g.54865  ORF Transcript_20569/g.54865 Transcript_20569/m.54865 type:complete len:333 (+) Transcript_20569:1435-2433(+)